jgi:putative CocE/NonD family hydrolase
MSNTRWDSHEFGRRTVLQSLGAAGALGLGAGVSGNVRAAGTGAGVAGPADAREQPRPAAGADEEYPVVRGSTEQVLVVAATEGATLTLLDADGATVETAEADDFGSYAFREVDPGDGYQVTETVDGEESTLAEAVTVFTREYTPPQELYDEQTLTEEFQYLEVRDGTKLACQAHFPPGDPPYPTLVVYSGYAPSVNLPVPPGLINVFGYAVVGVNKRGTQCSGGKFDFWEYLQWLDGYDIIETVGAQDWADGIGMLGASYSGYSQFFGAVLQPPSLDAIAPVVPVDDFYRGVGYPGGMLNATFATGWAHARDVENEPYPDDPGRGDVDERVENDEICNANQWLGLQNEPTEGRLVGTPYTGEFFEERSPWYLVEDIEVPTLLVTAWQDEQVGSRPARLLERFDDDTPVRFLGINGGHSGPQVALDYLLDFYAFYVKEEVPGGYEGSYEEALATYEAEDPYTVQWEQDHEFNPRFSSTYAEWPPGETWELFLQPGGALADEPPTGTGESSYEYVAPATDDQLIPREDGKLVWEQGAEGPGVSFVSDVLPTDHVLVGSGMVELYLQSTADDTDVQVFVSEIRPDGTEMYVQSGWLRASHRAEDASKSKPRRPWHPHSSGAQEPLPDGEFARLPIELFPFGHVFRAGSRLKLTVSNPGGTRDRWAFDAVDETATNTVAHSAESPSKVELPLVPDEQAAVPTRPACGEVRRQPCRPADDGPVDLPPVVEGGQPQDHDGDGLFEDITGSGEATVLDVQVLFDNLGNPAVQDSAWAYNFSRSQPERVSIFDVQALFSRL